MTDRSHDKINSAAARLLAEVWAHSHSPGMPDSLRLRIDTWATEALECWTTDPQPIFAAPGNDTNPCGVCIAALDAESEAIPILAERIEKLERRHAAPLRKTDPETAEHREQ